MTFDVSIMADTPKTVMVKFISVTSDGSQTDAGFKMNFEGKKLYSLFHCGNVCLPKYVTSSSNPDLLGDGLTEWIAFLTEDLMVVDSISLWAKVYLIFPVQKDDHHRESKPIALIKSLEISSSTLITRQMAWF